MKLIAFAILSVSVIACGPDKKAEKSLQEYEKFVAEHTDHLDEYLDKEWSEIEQNYNDVQHKAEMQFENYDQHMRARYESIQLDWASFREKYIAEMNNRDTQKGSQAVLSSLLPEGINNDMSNVDNSNVQRVYEHFVTSVDAMKDNLTREQWDQVEFMWERLDSRKNELEKNMTKPVNMAIAEQKVKYGSIKVANRPVAKGEENAAAKEK